MFGENQTNQHQHAAIGHVHLAVIEMTLNSRVQYKAICPTVEAWRKRCRAKRTMIAISRSTTERQQKAQGVAMAWSNFRP